MSRQRTHGRALPFPPDAADSPARFPARFIGGIDEAGLGPLLGPLTIGFAVFRVPDPNVDLWSALETAVVRTLEDCDGTRIAVADSKVLFDRTPRGEARLETCALAFLALAAASRRAPSNGIELLHRIPAALRGSGRLFSEPWISFLPDRLPLFIALEELERAVERLRNAARAREIEIVAAGTRVVPVSELNASFERTDNKSRTHWDLSAGILRLLWDDHARQGLDLLVDRHGGRMRYGPLLRETFPEATVTILGEESSRSEYKLRENGTYGRRWMRIVFAERAESASLPVALASCLAKHARETCMRGFNAYFLSLQPGLRATAGYLNDGRRWLAEARSALAAAGLPDSELLRAR